MKDIAIYGAGGFGREVACLIKRINDHSPNAFEDSVRDACRLVEKKQNEHKILFMQSWNEWGEGNYVEPDLKFGHGYLDALKNALFH